MPKEDTQWKPGQSGNPSGRPKGTLKDYVKRKLCDMSEQEKEEFLRKVAPDLQWQMAEGRPSGEDKVELTGKLEIDLETKQKIDKAIDEVI